MMRITGPLWGEIHQWTVDFPQKGSVVWNAFPFRDVTMGIERKIATLVLDLSL